MSAPTEPGWYRAVVMNTWEVVKVTRGSSGLKALVLGEWRAFDWGRREGGGLVVSEWGSRVEFPGDEPAATVLQDPFDKSDGLLRQLNRCTAQVGEALGVPDPSALSWCDVLAAVRKLAEHVSEPARGPLTPDSEGWWWRWTDAVSRYFEGCWEPMRVAAGSGGVPAPGLVYEHGWVKDDGHWGGRAVPPVTPAVEPEDEPTPDLPEGYRRTLPPNWIIEELDDGKWRCCNTRIPHGFIRKTRGEVTRLAWKAHERRLREASLPEAGADEPTLEPPPGWTLDEHGLGWMFGRWTREAAIVAAWECVRKRDAEPQDDPMTAKGADLNAVGRRLGVLRRYKSPDWETDEAFRGRLASAGGVRKREAPPAGWRVTLTAGLNWRASRAGTKGSFIFATYEKALAHARRCADDAEHESLPVGVPRAPEQDWTWVEACPAGERREQTMYVGGDAVEDRVVDRKDEP